MAVWVVYDFTVGCADAMISGLCRFFYESIWCDGLFNESERASVLVFEWFNKKKGHLQTMAPSFLESEVVDWCGGGDLNPYALRR